MTIALIAHHPLADFAEGTISEVVRGHQRDISVVDQGLHTIGMGVIGVAAQGLEFRRRKLTCQWRGGIHEMCPMFRLSSLKKLTGMYIKNLCNLTIDQNFQDFRWLHPAGFPRSWSSLRYTSAAAGFARGGDQETDCGRCSGHCSDFPKVAGNREDTTTSLRS